MGLLHEQANDIHDGMKERKWVIIMQIFFQKKKNKGKINLRKNA